MYTSFSYFEDDEDDCRVVANVYEPLKTGYGFSRVNTYGDLDGNPYAYTARRMIAMGRK